VTELMSTLEKLHRLYTGRTVVLKSIDMLSAEDRRTALRYLLDGGTTVYSEPVQDGTGLPPELRGAIHALTRNYAANLVVDAAMLEMSEEHRREVARCFLPIEPEPNYIYIDMDGEQLLQSDKAETSFRMRDASGEVTYYRLSETMPEFGPDGTKRMLACYIKVEAK
jgi:hypothetical protein